MPEITINVPISQAKNIQKRIADDRNFPKLDDLNDFLYTEIIGFSYNIETQGKPKAIIAQRKYDDYIKCEQYRHKALLTIGKALIEAEAKFGITILENRRKGLTQKIDLLRKDLKLFRLYNSKLNLEDHSAIVAAKIRRYFLEKNFLKENEFQPVESLLIRTLSYFEDFESQFLQIRHEIFKLTDEIAEVSRSTNMEFVIDSELAELIGAV